MASVVSPPKPQSPRTLPAALSSEHPQLKGFERNHVCRSLTVRVLRGETIETCPVDPNVLGQMFAEAGSDA